MTKAEDPDALLVDVVTNEDAEPCTGCGKDIVPLNAVRLRHPEGFRLCFHCADDYDPHVAAAAEALTEMWNSMAEVPTDRPEHPALLAAMRTYTRDLNAYLTGHATIHVGPAVGSEPNAQLRVVTSVERHPEHTWQTALDVIEEKLGEHNPTTGRVDAQDLLDALHDAGVWIIDSERHTQTYIEHPPKQLPPLDGIGA